MTFALAERITWIATIGATAALLVKLRRTKLDTSYRFLMAYLAWQVVGSGLLFGLPSGGKVYAYTYMGLTVVEWVIYILVILELVSQVSRNYPGIASVARKLVKIALPVSAVIALATAGIDLSGSTEQGAPVLALFQLTDRTVSIDVLVFLTSIVIFLMWFPVTLSRNTVAYIAGFLIIFCVKSSILLLGNLLGLSQYTVLNVALMALILGVLLYWLFNMNRAHEQTAVVVRQAWTRAGENRLMEQLETINESLLRTTTKGRHR